MAQSSQLRTRTVDMLFPLVTRFRVVKLGKADGRRWTDNLGVLREMILANQDMYPGIDRWFAKKVVPGLKSSERVAYVAYEDERPIAAAILKLGSNAKFCHLKVQQDFQDMDLGQMFFAQMTMESYGLAKEIHFTVPESLWSEKSAFFESFGFSCVGRAYRQYRHGDVELSCSARYDVVWSAVLGKLPSLLGRFSPTGYSLKKQIMMSMKPKYAERVLSGSKQVEVRKKFSRRWVGSNVLLYSSRPVSSVVGEAVISSVTYGSPREIWSKWKSSLGCSWEEYQGYVASATKVNAIELGNVTRYRRPMSLGGISRILDQDLRPPQSFCDLRSRDDNPWKTAAAFISLLQGHIHQPERFLSHRQTIPV